jgi:hypothetical protein
MDRVAVALFLGFLAIAGVASFIASNGPTHIAVTLLQAITLAVFVLLAAFSIPSHKRNTALWVLLAGQYVLVLINWLALMANYGEVTRTGATDYVAGFPTATFLMVAGTAFTALPLVALYVFGFRRFIFSHEDEARFEAIVRDARALETSNADKLHTGSGAA